MKDNIYNKNIEDKAWGKMLKILDNEMPVNKNRKFYLWAAILIGLLGFGYWVLPSNSTHNIQLAKAKTTIPTSKQNTQTIDNHNTDNLLNLPRPTESHLTQSSTTKDKTNISFPKNNSSNNYNSNNKLSNNSNHKINTKANPIHNTYISHNTLSVTQNNLNSKTKPIVKNKNHISLPIHQSNFTHKSDTNLSNFNFSKAVNSDYNKSLEDITTLPILSSKILKTQNTTIAFVRDYLIYNNKTINKWHPFIGANINYISLQSGLGYDLLAGINYDISSNLEFGINGGFHYASYNLSSPFGKAFDSESTNNKVKHFDETAIGSSSLETYLSVGYKLSNNWRLSVSAGFSKSLDTEKISYEADQLYSNKENDSNTFETNENYSLEDFKSQLDKSIIFNNYIPLGKIELKYSSFKHFVFNAGYIYSTKSYIKEINFSRYDISQSNISGSRLFIGVSYKY